MSKRKKGSADGIAETDKPDACDAETPETTVVNKLDCLDKKIDDVIESLKSAKKKPLEVVRDIVAVLAAVTGMVISIVSIITSQQESYLKILAAQNQNTPILYLSAPEQLLINISKNIVVTTTGDFETAEYCIKNVGQGLARNVSISFRLSDNPRLENDPLYSDLSVYDFRYGNYQIPKDGIVPINSAELTNLLAAVAHRYTGGDRRPPTVYLRIEALAIDNSIINISQMINIEIIDSYIDPNTDEFMNLRIAVATVYDR